VKEALSPISLSSIACALGAAAILVGFLVRRPTLSAATKVWLLFGLGVLPIGAATTGNVQGYETTKARSFCGSCHVMDPHANDAADRGSGSLASRHSRNALFGDESCYGCHADYGMFGTVTTKLGGMRHVYEYYLTPYRTMPLEEAKTKIHLYKPFSNETCMHCHSTELDIWSKVKEHRSSLEEVRSNRVSCASVGCHGWAHPMTKPAETVAR
jgi:cytochrome c-type protein NapC